MGKRTKRRRAWTKPSHMTDALLSMENVQRHYDTPAGVVKALDGVSFDIRQGERAILLGPSGSGKTTLLNCLSALDSPTGGSYTFLGQEVPRNHSENMTSFRRDNIGYVFQFFNLLQDLTVLENILLIQELAGKKDPARAKELLGLVGLEAEVNRFPGEISGGQQQRGHRPKHCEATYAPLGRRTDRQPRHGNFEQGHGGLGQRLQAGKHHVRVRHPRRGFGQVRHPCDSHRQWQDHFG